MSNHIVEVHSITTAPPGWKLVQSQRSVACFALVTTSATAHPGQFNERRVIPLTELDLNTDLLGRPVDDLEDEATYGSDAD